MEIKIGKIRDQSTTLAAGAAIVPAPSASCDGWWIGDTSRALLRITSAATVPLDLHIYTNGAGGWYESPADRVVIPAGEDYTQLYEVGPAQKIAERINTVPDGQVVIEWAFT